MSRNSKALLNRQLGRIVVSNNSSVHARMEVIEEEKIGDGDASPNNAASQLQNAVGGEGALDRI